MSQAYDLTWKTGRAGPVPSDGSVFRPDVLCKLDLPTLRIQTMRIGHELVPLADLFDIQAHHGEQGRLYLWGAPPFDRLGADMCDGYLFVGEHAGDDLGASMRGGCIQVIGDVGQRVGGPDTTSDRGMTGGHIIIHGSAGDHVGLRMRRGMIAILGRVGQSPGYRMLAGTIALGRGPFDYPGLEMRRGTLLLLDPAAAPINSPNFREEGVFDAASFPVLRLMLAAMKLPRILAERGRLPERYRLLTGDHFELGKGEIWQWVN